MSEQSGHAASVQQPGDPNDPVLAARNRKLGALLTIAVLTVVGVFMWRFSDIGLPPDRKMIEREQQRQSAEQPIDQQQLTSASQIAPLTTSPLETPQQPITTPASESAPSTEKESR